MTGHQWCTWKLLSLTIRNRYAAITGSRPLRTQLPLPEPLSPVTVADLEELQDHVEMIRVTVVEVLQMAAGTETEAVTAAEVQEAAVLPGPPLRPEARGRPAHLACQVVLAEAIN